MTPQIQRLESQEGLKRTNSPPQYWHFDTMWDSRISRRVQLTTSASRTYWTIPRNAYTASLTAARHHASEPGAGGATAPFTYGAHLGR